MKIKLLKEDYMVLDKEGQEIEVMLGQDRCQIRGSGLDVLFALSFEELYKAIGVATPQFLLGKVVLSSEDVCRFDATQALKELQQYEKDALTHNYHTHMGVILEKLEDYEIMLANLIDMEDLDATDIINNVSAEICSLHEQIEFLENSRSLDEIGLLNDIRKAIVDKSILDTNVKQMLIKRTLEYDPCARFFFSDLGMGVKSEIVNIVLEIKSALVEHLTRRAELIKEATVVYRKNEQYHTSSLVDFISKYVERMER